MLVSKQDKIDLINTLNKKVIDWDADGEVCYYVKVKMDDETRRVLKDLGKNDDWIKANIEADDEGQDNIDIAPVGFEFANWWYEGEGFSLYAPPN